MAIDYSKAKNKDIKFGGTEGIIVPRGTTAERPPGGEQGLTRYNTDSGTLEFYDGTSWISTNLIPVINSISGDIIAGLSSNLTISVSNTTDTVDVVYTEGGVEIGRANDQTVSAGSVTTAVPSGAFNQTQGDTINVNIANVDGTPSNAIAKTVQAGPTGGTISSTNIGGTDYRIHEFTSVGNSAFVWPSGLSRNIDMLLVAGGGGSGWDLGGGGGGGGVVYLQNAAITPNTYTITVGDGGRGASTHYSLGTAPGVNGENGQNSTALGYTAVGGGGSGYQNGNTNGTAGGSGGGGAGSGQSTSASTQPSTVSGLFNNAVGYGNTGGGSGGASPNYPGGGGGGAGGAGQTPSSSSANGGQGGNGIQINIDGNNYYWGGGGGGAVYTGGNPAGNGGLGGGGGGGVTSPGGSPGSGGGSAKNTGGNGYTQADGTSTFPPPQVGGANTGGGAGGSHNNNPSGNGAKGGSGICIIRYPIS